MPDFRVIVSGLMYGQLCQHRIHLQGSDPAQSAQSVASYVKTNFVDKVTIFQNANLKYISILVQILEDGAPAPFSLIFERLGQGFNDRRIPSTLTYVIKLQTATGGKSGRGRIILPGVQSDSIQDGFLTASALESWQETVISPMMAAFLDNPSTTLVWCVRDKNHTMHPVTNMQMRSLVGQLRRRQPGVGV
jgi:hypothetical protein